MPHNAEQNGFQLMIRAEGSRAVVVISEDAEQVNRSLISDLGSKCVTNEMGEDELKEGRNCATLPDALRGMDDSIRLVVIDMVVCVLMPAHHHLDQCGGATSCAAFRRGGGV